MPRNGRAAGDPGCRQASATPRGNGSRGGAGRIEGMPAAKPAGCRGWLLPHLQAREEAAAGRTAQQDILQSGPWRCAAIPAAGPAAGAPAAAREHPAVAVPGAGMPAAASKALNSAAASLRIGARIPPFQTPSGRAVVGSVLAGLPLPPSRRLGEGPQSYAAAL